MLIQSCVPRQKLAVLLGKGITSMFGHNCFDCPPLLWLGHRPAQTRYILERQQTIHALNDPANTGILLRSKLLLGLHQGSKFSSWWRIAVICQLCQPNSLVNVSDNGGVSISLLQMSHGMVGKWLRRRIGWQAQAQIQYSNH